MKSQLIASAVIFYNILLFMSPITYGQNSESTKPVQHQLIDEFELARRQAESSLEIRREMRVNRAYDLNDCSAFSFLGDEEKLALQSGDVLASIRLMTVFENAIVQIFRDLGIFAERPPRLGSNGKDSTTEYRLREFEFHEKAEGEGKDGDKFVIARVLVGTCNSMAAEDIDLMYYVFRNLLQFRPIMGSKGTFDDPEEVIGDGCYHLSHDAIGFLRGNVVVEIHASAYEWRDGRIMPLGKPEPLRAKMVEAARRIDALLMEKMFTEDMRTRIRAAIHRLRRESRPPRLGSNGKDSTTEYRLREFEFHEKAEGEGKDGDKFVIARVLVGTCNSMAAEDIDLMYYVFRNLLQFRPIMGSKGTFDDPEEVIGDGCYHLSHDAIGFLRGNVVVEIHASAYEWRDGRIMPLGKPEPLRAKMVEAARRIDALLMEKMFTEDMRTRIRAAEHKRRLDRRGKSRETDK